VPSASTTRRASKRSRASSPEARHALLGVLRAELGTVPRALDGAGIDRAALAASV
jgi:hypothetical protein